MSDNLQKCISILYDMELNNYLMENMISSLNEKISVLGKHRVYKKQHDYDTTDSIFFTVVLGVLAGLVLGVIGGIKNNHGFFNKLTAAIITAIIYAVIFGVIGFVLGAIVGAAKKKRIEKNLEAEYQSDLAIDNQRIARENTQKTALIKVRDQTYERLSEARNKLGSYYVKTGIDSTYRNIVCMAYMNEFIRLGISRKLDGVDGLYYLVKNELHAVNIELSLQDISSKLDVVINNQRNIYFEINEINKKCDSLVESTINNTALLNEAVVNTSIAAYNTERIKQENEYQSLLMTAAYYL